jgi:endonuclease-8
MPEGDTIAYAARRMRPVLEGHVPEQIRTPQPRHAMDRWPQRLAGRSVTEVRTHGKHLFIRFEGQLTVHSHLRMTGSWAVHETGARWRRSPRRAWLVLERAGHQVVQFDGPVLELLTESRAALLPVRRPGSPDRAAAASSSCFDQRLAGLGPDVLAAEFAAGRFLARLRGDDPTRGIGEAVLDQRNVAGIGNIWKAEGCWEAGVDPWRPVGEVTDAEAVAIIDGLRPRMLESARSGRMLEQARVFRRNGRPCPRCGTKILAQRQGDDNRTTFWCPGCQR